MKLNFLERFVLLNVLPKEGTYLTLKALRELREQLSPTEEEQKATGLRSDDQGRVAWDATKDHPVDIPISLAMTALISEELRRLDSAKQLTDQHLSIYEKFCI